MTSAAVAQEGSAGSFAIWPSASVAFPTGRFAEKDETAGQMKPGHKTGYTLGGEAGYFFSDALAAGLGYGYTSFTQEGVDPNVSDGSTTAQMMTAWGRYFLRGSHEGWRPYLLLSAGVAQPKGELTYDPPQYGLGGIPDTTERLESTVDWTSTVSVGAGVLIPAGRLGIAIEPRFVSIQSKGTERTDTFHFTDGTSFEGKIGGDGNPLKAKAHTNWFEVRFGVVFTIR